MPSLVKTVAISDLFINEMTLSCFVSGTIFLKTQNKRKTHLLAGPGVCLQILKILHLLLAFPRNLFLASHQTGSFKVSFFVEKFKSVIQEMLRNVKTFKDLFWLHFDVNVFLQCKILFILKSVLMWLVLSNFSYFLLRLCPSPLRESLLILPGIVSSSP